MLARSIISTRFASALGINPIYLKHKKRDHPICFGEAFTRQTSLANEVKN